MEWGFLSTRNGLRLSLMYSIASRKIRNNS